MDDLDRSKQAGRGVEADTIGPTNGGDLCDVLQRWHHTQAHGDRISSYLLASPNVAASCWSRMRVRAALLAEVPALQTTTSARLGEDYPVTSDVGARLHFKAAQGIAGGLRRIRVCHWRKHHQRCGACRAGI